MVNYGPGLVFRTHSAMCNKVFILLSLVEKQVLDIQN